MEMAIDVAILLASISAGLYCWLLNRALSRLHREKENVAVTIAQLDRAVTDCRQLFAQANAIAIARWGMSADRVILRADEPLASGQS